MATLEMESNMTGYKLTLGAINYSPKILSHKKVKC